MTRDVIGNVLSCSAVCFDVDSTVQPHEGIDRLAEHCGALDAVKALTKSAMSGSIKFEDALRVRLELIRPTRDQVEYVAELAVELVPYVDELISLLRRLGKDVFLVSGGFRRMIDPLARQLGIPNDHVFANTLLFDHQGVYNGFDAQQLTSRTGGKRKVIEQIQKQFGHEEVVMIGDGVTDLEARPPAIAFIGFGGVQNREPVRLGCDLFVEDFRDLIRAIEERQK